MTTRVPSLRGLNVRPHLLSLCLPHLRALYLWSLWCLVVCRYNKQSIIPHLLLWSSQTKFSREWSSKVQAMRRFQSNMRQCHVVCSRWRFNEIQSCEFNFYLNTSEYQNTAWAWLEIRLHEKLLGIIKMRIQCLKHGLLGTRRWENGKAVFEKRFTRWSSSPQLPIAFTKETIISIVAPIVFSESITIHQITWWHHQWKQFPRYWPLDREFTGHGWIPATKVSNAELWCFLWFAPE